MVNRLERNFLTLSLCNQMFFSYKKKGKRQTEKNVVAVLRLSFCSTLRPMPNKMLNYSFLGRENSAYTSRVTLACQFNSLSEQTLPCCLTSAELNSENHYVGDDNLSFGFPYLFLYRRDVDENWIFFLDFSSSFSHFQFMFDSRFIRVDIVRKSASGDNFFCAV